MLEVLTERHKSIYVEYFNLNEKKFFYKRLLIAILFLLVYALLILRLDNLWYLIGIPFVMLLGFKIPYLEVVSKKEKDDIVKQYVFPSFLRYFISLIDTQGNVYQTLKSVVPYVNEPIKSELKNLVRGIEEKNTNNREAFMEFADFIGSSEAHLIMGMIYEFNEEGINKEDIRELENTINQLQENKTNELIEKKAAKMEKHADPILYYALGYIIAFTILVYVAYMNILL